MTDTTCEDCGAPWVGTYVFVGAGDVTADEDQQTINCDLKFLPVCNVCLSVNLVRKFIRLEFTVPAGVGKEG